MQQRRLAVSIALVVLTLAVSAFQSLHFVWAYDFGRGHMSFGALLLQNATLPLFFTLWVQADARCRRRWPCFDFGTFVLFAWPIAIPCYLITGRGAKGVLLSLGLLAVWLTPWMVTLTVAIWIDMLRPYSVSM